MKKRKIRFISIEKPDVSSGVQQDDVGAMGSARLGGGRGRLCAGGERPASEPVGGKLCRRPPAGGLGRAPARTRRPKIRADSAWEDPAGPCAVAAPGSRHLGGSGGQSQARVGTRTEAGGRRRVSENAVVRNRCRPAEGM